MDWQRLLIGIIRIGYTNRYVVRQSFQVGLKARSVLELLEQRRLEPIHRRKRRHGFQETKIGAPRYVVGN